MTNPNLINTYKILDTLHFTVTNAILEGLLYVNQIAYGRRQKKWYFWVVGKFFFA